MNTSTTKGLSAIPLYAKFNPEEKILCVNSVDLTAKPFNIFFGNVIFWKYSSNITNNKCS